jgi:hypothetical protein
MSWLNNLQLRFFFKYYTVQWDNYINTFQFSYYIQKCRSFTEGSSILLFDLIWFIVFNATFSNNSTISWRFFFKYYTVQCAINYISTFLLHQRKLIRASNINTRYQAPRIISMCFKLSIYKNVDHLQKVLPYYYLIWFDLLCLTLLSAIIQLYHGDQL